MSVYRTLTVQAQLSSNQINASANVNGNISADANLSTDISVNNVSDYELLNNKPQINSVSLVGDKSFEDLGLEGISNIELEEILN